MTLLLFNGGCDEGSAGVLSTTTPETNPQRNAQGQALFTPGQLAPFARLVFGIRWTLVAKGAIAYRTQCIAVAID